VVDEDPRAGEAVPPVGLIAWLRRKVAPPATIVIDKPIPTIVRPGRHSRGPGPGAPGDGRHPASPASGYGP
jgi:hypothetical protein